MPTTTTKQEPGRRQTGVKLDSALLREFKVLAAKNDTTLGELLEAGHEGIPAKSKRARDPERLAMSQPTAYSYIRFSTPEQRKGDSLRRQLEDSQKWADEHGYVIWTNKLRDEGRSAYHGDHLERGALGQFSKKVEDGRITKEVL